MCIREKCVYILKVVGKGKEGGIGSKRTHVEGRRGVESETLKPCYVSINQSGPRMKIGWGCAFRKLSKNLTQIAPRVKYP